MSHDLSLQYICRSYFIRCTSWTRASRVWLEHLANKAQYILGMWGELLPDLSEHSENPDPAHGGSLSDLPELPELPHVPANGGGSGSLLGLPDLPDLPDDSAGQMPSQKLWDRSYMRVEALQDIPIVAAKYGADLLDVPNAWLDPISARQLVCAAGLGIMLTLPVFLMEIFAGCAHLTKAACSAGLRVAPSIDVLPADGEYRCVLDLLSIQGREMLWALLAVLKPFWVHIGYPCTFWSQLAHMTRKQSDTQNEETRLRELVFIIIARQIAQWQASRWQHVSIENPPRCRSWDLDIVQDILRIGGMVCVDMDLCCWGAIDPGNGLSYKKAIRLASTVDLSELYKRCLGHHEHQRVEGAVCSGPRKGERRSRISGEYPMPLCRAWVACMERIYHDHESAWF